jgi:adenylosuccinate lyase
LQSWVCVEEALTGAQTELGIIPKAAGHEIARIAPVKYLDYGAER